MPTVPSEDSELPPDETTVEIVEEAPAAPRRRSKKNTESSVRNSRSNTKYDVLDPDMNSNRFANRRRMAWSALLVIYTIVGLVFFYLKPDDIHNYEGILGWILTTLTGIVFTYMGASSWQYNTYIKSKNQKNGEPDSTDQQ